MNRRSSIALALGLLTVAAFPPPDRSAWFGTWQLRLTAPGEKPETLVYSDAGNGAMRMVSVEEGSVLVTRFDGEPSVVAGAPGAPARTLAIRAVSPTVYRWTFSRAGTPIARGRNSLAADGRSFTEVSWPVSDPDKRITLVYDRR